MGPIAQRTREIAKQAKSAELVQICHQIADVDARLDVWVAERFKKGVGTEDDYFRVMEVTETVWKLLSSENSVFTAQQLKSCLDALNATLESLPP